MRKGKFVPCACGCGTFIKDWVNGTPRRFYRNHQHRRPGCARTEADKTTAKIIDCECGCGGILLNRDTRGRPKSFIPSHASRIQPHSREPVTCQNCGKVFLKAQWRLKRSKRHFCSLKCEGEASSRNGSRRGPNNGHYNSVTVACSTCGKPITKAYSLIYRRNNRVYCRGCTYPRRPGARGFYVGYPKEFDQRLRNKIRERDKQTCQHCGKHRDEVGTLHVHHIDYTKTNTDESNLISLCNSCHGRTNFGHAKWQELFQAKMAVALSVV